MLIEKRIERQARRQVAASRLEPDQVIYSALGPCPADDAGKAVWDEGAYTIALYRHRHAVGDDVNPLGKQPSGAAARSERARAQRRVEDVQRSLGKTVDRSTERTSSPEKGAYTRF